MTKEEINNYSLRISQCNKTQLIAITYEIIVNYLESAFEAEKAKNEREFIYNLQKAQQFVNDLTSALDYSYEISYDLLSLYSYANKCLTKSIVRKENCDLITIRNMMNQLRDCFDKVSKEDKSGVLMKNSEPVYAGLTYGRTSLNEVAERGSTYN